MVKTISEIVAGAKAAVTDARDDADPEIRVGLETVQHRRELPACRRVQRIHHVRTLQRNDQGPAFLLNPEEFRHWGGPEIPDKAD
jgi:hypothetical protein